MIAINDYSITFKATIKVQAKSFKDINLEEMLEKTGEIETLDIENVMKGVMAKATTLQQ